MTGGVNIHSKPTFMRAYMLPVVGQSIIESDKCFYQDQYYYCHYSESISLLVL